MIGGQERRNAFRGTQYCVQVASQFVEVTEILAILSDPEGREERVTPFLHSNGVMDFVFLVGSLGVYSLNITLRGSHVEGSPVRVHSLFHESYSADLGFNMQCLRKFEEGLRSIDLPLTDPDLNQFVEQQAILMATQMHDLQSKIEKVRLATLIGPRHRNDAVNGRNYSLQVATFNLSPRDVKVDLLGSPSYTTAHLSLGNTVQIHKHANGVMDITFPIQFVGEFSVSIAVEGKSLSSSPVTVHSFAETSLSPTHKAAIEKAHALQSNLRSLEIPIVCFESDLRLFFATQTEEIEKNFNVIEKETKPLHAHIIGGAVREDAFVHTPFLLQVVAPSASPDLFSVKLEGATATATATAAPPTSSITPNPNGVFDIYFTPEIEGSYSMYVTFQGQNVAPFPVTIRSKRSSNLTPRQQEIVSDLDIIARRMRSAELPYFSSSTDLVLHLKPVLEEVTHLSRTFASEKRKEVRLLGPNPRCDAITGRPFTFQVATVNVDASDVLVKITDAKGNPCPCLAQSTLYPNGVLAVTFDIPSRGTQPYSVSLNLADGVVVGMPLRVVPLESSSLTPALLCSINRIASLLDANKTAHIPDLDAFLLAQTKELGTPLKEVEELSSSPPKACVIGLPTYSNRSNASTAFTAFTAFTGQPYVLQVATLNATPKQLSVTVKDSSGRPLEGAANVIAYPNGIMDVKLTPFPSPGSYTLDLRVNGSSSPASTVLIRVRDAVPFTPEVQALTNEKDKIEQEIRRLPTPLNERELQSIPHTFNVRLSELESQISAKLKPVVFQSSAQQEMEKETKKGFLGGPLVMDQISLSNALPSDVTFEVYKDGTPFSIPVTLEVNSMDPSRFDVVFSPTVPGNYTLLNMFIGKEALPNFLPVQMEVKGAPKLTFLPDANTVGKMIPGHTARFEVSSEGSSHPPDHRNISISITSPSGEEVPSTLTSTPTGKMDVEFRPSVPGKYLVNAQIAGAPNPVLHTLDIHLASDPELTLIPKLAKGTNHAHTVLCVGAKGCIAHFCLASGHTPDDIEVQIIDPSGLVEGNAHIVAEGPDTYQIQYAPITPGPHTAVVLLHGKKYGRVEPIPFIAQRVQVDPVCTSHVPLLTLQG